MWFLFGTHVINQKSFFEIKGEIVSFKLAKYLKFWKQNIDIKKVSKNSQEKPQTTEGSFF